MPITLHAATVPSMLQVLGAGKGWLDKASASDHAEDVLHGACIVEGMLPFAYQVKSMAVHSAGAIEGVRAGMFHPDMAEPPADFAGLHARLDEAIATLSDVTEDEMESFIGRDMRFEIPGRDFGYDFVAEDFLLSFSQPNFYFHATTAYDILRMRGLNIGKRDFLMGLRVRS